MDKVNEYRRRAEECWEFAAASPADIKPHWDELALMWDRMAEERMHFFIPPEPTNRQDKEAG